MTSENDSNIIKEEENVIREEELPLPMDIKNEEEEINVPSSEEQPMNTDEVDVPSKSETNIHSVLDQSVIIEGKRSRKPTLRLEISESLPAKKEIAIPQGHGKPLGEIEYINYQITHASTDALSRMRNICFGRRGNKATIRKNLRAFKGFEFDLNSVEYRKHFNNLIKFKKDELRSISNILGLPATGRNTDHVERILNFLIKPIDEGKKIPGRKSAARNIKKRSTNSKESIDTNQETITENGKDDDYNFKPGKRASDQEHSSNIKRKKGVSKSKENDYSIEQPSKTVEDVI
jgi:hypothetical protein